MWMTEASADLKSVHAVDLWQHSFYCVLTLLLFMEFFVVVLEVL